MKEKNDEIDFQQRWQSIDPYIYIYVYYCTLAAEETILSFKMLKFSKITSLKNPNFVKYKYLKQLQPLRKHPPVSTTFISTRTHYRICSMISILYT
jgi:hypothetical protein